MDRAWLWSLMCVALLLRLGAAALWPGAYRPDENFQTLEPAHALATGWGVLAREFREGARSWMFPGVLAALMLPGWGARFYLPLIAALLSLLSLGAVWAAWRAGRLGGDTRAGLLAAGVVALWPETIYFAPHPLPEIVGAHLVLLGMATALGGRRLALAGLLLGLAFTVRLHMAPAIAVIGLWCLWRHGARALPPLLAGAAGPLLLLGAVDWATWGAPFASIWTYFRIQVLEGFAAHDGVMSPWFYFTSPLATWGLPAIAVALLALAGARRMGLAVAVIVACVAFHSAFAFKLPSYVYIAVPLLLATAAVGTLRLTSDRFLPAAALWLVLIALVAQHPASRAMWSSMENYRQAMGILRDLPGLCGVAGIGDRWWVSYALMDREVPAFLGPAERVLPAANAYLVGPETNVPGTETLMDRDGLRLLVLPGSCTQSPADEINTVLRRENW